MQLNISSSCLEDITLTDIQASKKNVTAKIVQKIKVHVSDQFQKVVQSVSYVISTGYKKKLILKTQRNPTDQSFSFLFENCSLYQLLTFSLIQ